MSKARHDPAMTPQGFVFAPADGTRLPCRGGTTPPEELLEPEVLDVLAESERPVAAFDLLRLANRPSEADRLLAKVRSHLRASLTRLLKVDGPVNRLVSLGVQFHGAGLIEDFNRWLKNSRMTAEKADAVTREVFRQVEFEDLAKRRVRSGPRGVDSSR